MDQDLLNTLSTMAPQTPGQKAPNARIRVVNAGTGEIEIEGRGGTARYTVKALAGLYGSGQGASSVEPRDDRYMPLFMEIEREIVKYYRVQPELTDGLVALALDRMSMNPAADMQKDPLGQQVQFGLRMCLSMHNYSKYEVQQAVRKIAKSVERHTKAAGIQGYLEFIGGRFESIT